eukprot:gene24071-biopygen13421
MDVRLQHYNKDDDNEVFDPVCKLLNLARLSVIALMVVGGYMQRDVLIGEHEQRAWTRYKEHVATCSNGPESFSDRLWEIDLQEADFEEHCFSMKMVEDENGRDTGMGRSVYHSTEEELIVKLYWRFKKPDGKWSYRRAREMWNTKTHIATAEVEIIENDTGGLHLREVFVAWHGGKGHQSPSFYKAGLAEPACGKRWGTRLRESHGSGPRGLSSREGWPLGNRRAQIVAEGGFLIAREVRLRDQDITPVDYCPCCSRMLHLDKLDVGLAPSMATWSMERHAPSCSIRDFCEYSPGWAGIQHSHAIAGAAKSTFAQVPSPHATPATLVQNQ